MVGVRTSADDYEFVIGRLQEHGFTPMLFKSAVQMTVDVLLNISVTVDVAEIAKVIAGVYVTRRAIRTVGVRIRSRVYVVPQTTDVKVIEAEVRRAIEGTSRSE